jgi:hypothetical protein
MKLAPQRPNTSLRPLRVPQVKYFEIVFVLLAGAALNDLSLVQYLLYHDRIHWLKGIPVQIIDRVPKLSTLEMSERKALIGR